MYPPVIGRHIRIKAQPQVPRHTNAVWDVLEPVHAHVELFLLSIIVTDAFDRSDPTREFTWKWSL